MFNLIEFLKNIFFPKKAASELVDNLKNSSELTNDQTHMLGNLLKLRKHTNQRHYGTKSRYSIYKY